MAALAPEETTSAHGARARQRQQTRARLLRAAREVIEEKGYLDVRVSDIVARAGVSHGLFYHYFDSKQQVMRELAEAVDRTLTDPMEVVLDPSSTAPPAVRLRTAIRLHFERYRDQARMMGVIEEVSHYDDGVSRAREARHQAENRRLTVAIRQLQRRGLADPRLDPEVAALAVGSLTWRFAERWLVKGELEADFDRVVEQLTIVVMNTLQVREGAGAGPGPAPGPPRVARGSGS